MAKGPLSGYRIIEIAGIGPGQLCGMLLADMGAQVLRISRRGGGASDEDLPARINLMNRSRVPVSIDLKSPQGVSLVLQLVESADALFEGFRPGVMERLGLGPDQCLARNPRLVYGRMTGWGQSGPMAQAAGHDTNYLALTGALAAIGERGGPPVLPLNLVADFGGGALYLAMGLLAALLETARSGQGQVVDAAMVDGVASMTTLFHGLKAGGMWQEHRGCNVLDGGTPFMRCYRTKDGGYMAVAALENRFYQQLLAGLGLDDVDPRRQMRYEDWPALEKRMAEAFEQRSRDEWQEVFSDRDACIAPVLSFSEATTNPHLEARGTFVEVDGIVQPAPAPRFSRTPGVISSPPCGPGEAETREALSGWGIAETEISRLLEAGTLSVG